MALLLLLAACGPGALVLPEDRSGSTVTLEPGQELVIEVFENASIGWQWDVTTDPDDAVLRFVDEAYEADSPDTAGSGGTDRFRFEAVGPGSTELVLSRDYRNERIDKTFELTVQVEEPA